MKILIVDDNADNRRLLRYNLEHYGCEVIEAMDGREGLEKASTQAPDMIISDAMMPVMDGFRFLRRLRQEGDLKEIPFVFFSATYTGEKEIQLAVALGADAFIVRPMEPEELWAEIKRTYEGYREKRELRQREQVISGDDEFLSMYTDILVSKLEKKVYELQQAKDQIEKNEKRYRNLFESSLDGIYQTNMDNVFTLINKAGAEIFGYRTPEEIIGKPVIDFWGEPGDRAVFFERIKASGSLRSYPVKAKRRDGEIIYLTVSSRILKDSEGNFTGIEGIIRDVTEQRKAEEALRESEMKFRALSMSTASAIFIYRVTFLYANPAAEALSGYTLEEIKGINFWDVVHPDFREVVKERGYARLRGEKVPDRYEFKILTKTGEEKWVDFTAGKITFEGGPAGLETAFDITKSKHAEEEVKKRMEELERFYEMAVGRELKMKELKAEIESLKDELSRYSKEDG